MITILPILSTLYGCFISSTDWLAATTYLNIYIRYWFRLTLFSYCFRLNFKYFVLTYGFKIVSLSFLFSFLGINHSETQFLVGSQSGMINIYDSSSCTGADAHPEPVKTLKVRSFYILFFEVYKNSRIYAHLLPFNASIDKMRWRSLPRV